jgi:hypothetical protein
MCHVHQIRHMLMILTTNNMTYQNGKAKASCSYWSSPKHNLALNIATSLWVYQIFWPFWVFQPFLYLSHTAYTDTCNHFYLCLLLIKWANDYCVMLTKQCFQLYRGENMLHFDEMSMIMSSFHWNSMLSWIGFCESASPLKEQSASRHVFPLRHIILIPSFDLT